MKNHIHYISLITAAFVLTGISKCKSPDLERAEIPPIDSQLQRQRQESARHFPQPEIHKIYRNGKVIWQEGSAAPTIYAGETLEIEGDGLGAGPDIDYTKILVGKARSLESDLQMYVGHIDVVKAHYFEEPKVFDSWKKGLLAWGETRIKFKVPETTDRGPLVVSVQKRIGANESLVREKQAHSVWDPNTERIAGKFDHKSDVVSKLSQPKLSQAIDVVVVNKNFKSRVLAGEKIFWSYGFNIGSVHNARDLDWTSILQKKTIDPVTGKVADPETLFGAILLRSSIEAPSFVRKEVQFDPYPIPNPLTSVVNGEQLYKGPTNPTGYAGYVYENSLTPETGKNGHWPGFSCVSCHGQKISFPDKATGKTRTKIFPGLPNPDWSLKWTVLSKFKGVKGKEEGISGDADKTMLLYSVPHGAGEHSMVRSSEDKHSPYRNDFLFSPIAIPNVTTHTPLRRSLSHTEFYAGFEGSYVHSEEPDGAIGSMYAEPLKSLTSYMTVLDKDDRLLRRLGTYRWLKENKMLDEVNNVSERTFIYSEDDLYPVLAARQGRGEESYQKNCLQCHNSNFGTGSDENMIPLQQVGMYFSPTIYQKEMQSIRTAMMTHLYWVQKRGLLHDTHVKSMEDLVDPDRCNVKSSLYKKYYTMHSGSFKVPVGTPEQAKLTEKHAYFTRVSWDPKHFYWDYQKMLKEFGPRELGTKKPIAMTPVPHPWCATSKSEIKDLVSYMLTL